MAIPDISVAISMAKGLWEIAAQTKEVKLADELRERSMHLTTTIYELQQFLLQEQATHSQLMEQIRGLEKQVADMEDWKRRSENDSLDEIAPGVYVYFRDNFVGTEHPFVKICTNCYTDRKESILQYTGNPPEGAVYRCPRCSNEFVDHTKSYSPYA